MAPRAVLDANLIVRGLLTPYGGAGRLLGPLARGRFFFVMSESILYEVATILSEPRVQRYGPFPQDEDDAKLAELGRFCRLMGRETNQGEVGVVIGDEYIAIRNMNEE